MKKIKLCEVCGKEVDPKRDKHLNIVNNYYHWECLGKERVAGAATVPNYTKDQIAEMTFDEVLTYLEDRIKDISSQHSIPEEETMELRAILGQVYDKYGAAAKNIDKTKK